MTITDIHDQNLLIFKAISGSKAYGTDLPGSDTDIKGVFVVPEKMFYSLEYPQQVSDEKNDEVYYELRRYLELLYLNNPNLLEMLATPEDCILYKHPLFDLIKPQIFLSKLCQQAFAGYAMTQVKKARGLNKKILNPLEPKRKTILDFCFVVKGPGSMPLKKWLQQRQMEQEHCGLVNIPHMKNMYALFYDREKGQAGLCFSGIMRKETANDVALSSIPKEMEPETWMYFHREGYSSYCKEYKEYWAWVEKRNEERYQNTLTHGKNYDAKNMMHTFRLLDMAEEIALHKQITVRRPNLDFLLKIRSGVFDYEELVQQAEERIDRSEELYAKSDLPEKPDLDVVNELQWQMKKAVYNSI